MIDFYLDVAERTAKLSRAIRLQVGAVIVKNDNIISFSWNGTPAGWDNNCEYKHYDLARTFDGKYFDYDRIDYPLQDEFGRYRLTTKPEVVHAEMNALLKLSKSHESALGATMFCTHAPCIDCSKFIFTAGIKKVYFRSHYRNDLGIDFLTKCGVDCEHIENNRG